ncbi:GGDEF domain-containing protein [Roseisolibacter sp. H3M3-2]|uniref:GGDEF domain-containing protein n=1 Tax=Roseisolibacter sp. H3M3-2 TaxID=3031323 RepID=UPI0023DAD817|nr:GGDEF domain-containing protein [Roseisolibacter sp. H3M3-2]MDF1501444.1 GGDEF domain-containing protein [Roseisolibacter sp. H3M3-2]
MTSVRRWFGGGAERPAPSRPAPPDVPATPSAPPTDDHAVGRMLDAVGALVHLVGKYALDTDTRDASGVRRQADRWRRHLTTGLALPTDDDGDAETATVRGGGLGERDWEGAVRFASTERRVEHAYATKTLEELRATVWALVHGLHDAVGAEAAAHDRSREVVGRLHAAVAESSPEQMRQAAQAAVGELGALLAARAPEREGRIAELGREVAALGAALEEARREGMTDALTGLGNRRAFDESLAHAVALHGLWGQRTCLLLLDLDHLKALNDREGHAAGDAALQRVAGQLSRTFLGRTDVVARIGGDEFAVLLRETSVQDGVRMGERLVAALAGATSVSVGVAALRAGETAARWTERADAALYAAKRDGRGRVSTGG